MARRELTHREPPQVIYKQYDPRLKRHPQIKLWLKQYEQDPTVLPIDVDEELLRFFILAGLGKGWNDFERRCFERAMEATTPVLSFPKLGGFVDSLEHITLQPEFKEFWNSWTAPRRNNVYERQLLEGTKALMTTMAVPASTMHAQNAHDPLDPRPDNKQFMPGLHNVFERLTDGFFAIPGYSTFMEHVQQPIAENCHAAAELGAVKILK